MNAGCLLSVVACRWLLLASGRDWSRTTAMAPLLTSLEPPARP